MNRHQTITAALVAAALVLTACGGDDDTAPATTDAPPASQASEPTEPAPEPPTTGPAAIAAADQAGDGTTVTVESVTLPTDGFVVIHADADGGPGAILGWSDLLPAGDTTGISVSLTEPLAASTVVHPMAHVDANGNGEYEFMPPDVTIDVPATTADGDVAMLPISYTVDAAADTDIYADPDLDAGTDDETGTADDAAGLQLASTPLGDVVAGADGWIVYLFTPDAQGESTCYDGCEANWPVVTSVTSVGDGLDPTLLGTTTRTDGTEQATYNGWPLYTFAGDPGPGMTNGQGVNGIWWVIDAAGDAVGT